MTQTISKDKRLRIANRLRQVMGRRTQTEWGHELGFPQQTISRYLKDGNALRMDFLLQLFRKDQVNVNWLLTGKGRMRRQQVQ
jgi:hypothetical protein